MPFKRKSKQRRSKRGGRRQSRKCNYSRRRQGGGVSNPSIIEDAGGIHTVIKLNGGGELINTDPYVTSPSVTNGGKRRRRRSSRRRRRQGGGGLFDFFSGTPHNINPVATGVGVSGGYTGQSGVLFGTNLVNPDPSQQNIVGYNQSNPRIA